MKLFAVQKVYTVNQEAKRIVSQAFACANLTQLVWMRSKTGMVQDAWKMNDEQPERKPNTRTQPVR